MNENCGNCRHWAELPVTPSSGLHRCKRIPVLRVDGRQERGAKAAVALGSLLPGRFGIEFLTHHSFRCSEYDARKPA